MTYVSTKLKKELVINEIITVHYFEYMKDFCFVGESHDFWEFLYVDKGEVTIMADDVFYQLHAGDIVFHRPNEFHAIHTTGKKAPNLVAISFRCDSPAIQFFEQKSCTLVQEERVLISRIISEARDAFSTPLHIPSVEQVFPSANAAFGAEQLILNYLEIFLIHVKRTHLDAKTNLTPARTSPIMDASINSNRLDAIIHYMEFRICEQLTVSDICNEFSISRSSLHALFHREKNCGAIDYFSYMKIERAREIMRDGSMNFTEIAYYLSYSSLQYFSKQFKKATGMSPLEYSSSVKQISNTLTTVDRKTQKETSS